MYIRYAAKTGEIPLKMLRTFAGSSSEIMGSCGKLYISVCMANINTWISIPGI